MHLRVVHVRWCVVCGGIIIKPPSISRANWPKRLYCKMSCKAEAQRGKPITQCVAANKGKRFSPERRVQISERMLRAHAEGRMHVIDNTGLRGERTSQWKGDKIAYRAAHWRLRTERGKAVVCEHCGTTEGWLDWALKKDAEAPTVRHDGPYAGLWYSPRPSDYISLCKRCHIKYDDRKQDPKTGRFLPK